ncbi:DNA-binding transcriptional LysR family regulator [Mycolicibacterium sp. BK634]|uniref:LysR family transcriptional regulator n=1 Tax=Mycobacteriaceae TaxID=1762 RepID=UPI00105E8AA8|nr:MULTISPECIES: LysR family transcriptional regulator [Mycobacteriaceae]MBB3754228.1 DNA-binding transcriptional LysR family regulator [Mycolicibacterium sp. BK634]TDO17808.1 DNA-binding transcriptional LysR family regulator [Mycobacterium sp. BK086]
MTTKARLRALVELADTGSVRGAAERLVVTESSISSAVRALSEEIGIALIDRNGRGVKLTAAGQRYVEYARRILGLHDEAILAARGEADPENGSVRLAAVTTAGELLIPAALASFRAKYPGVVLHLEVASRNAVWPMLARHEVDLVVAGRPPDDLRKKARVRAASPNTLIVVGPPSAAADFEPAAATWLLREPGSGTRSATMALLDDLDVSPPLLVLGSHGAVVAAAAAGLGVTLVSQQAVQTHLDSGDLVQIPVPGTPLNRPWHLVSQIAPTMSTELLVKHLVGQRGLGWRPISGVRSAAS